MTDMKMQDMKLTDQMTGHEIAGQKDTILTEIILQCTECSVQRFFLKNVRTQVRTASQVVSVYYSRITGNA